MLADANDLCRMSMSFVPSKDLVLSISLELVKGVSSAADAFPPLKSTAGGVLFIVEFVKVNILI